jgi:hypothetical protein
MSNSKSYRVVIPFREPTFERSIGRSPDAPPYVASYVVSACSTEEAQAQALELFWGLATESGVGWIREPVESAIRVELT